MSRLLLILALCCSLSAYSQTFTGRYNTRINNNSNGYWEYLPQGYDAAGTATYPLIVSLHGQPDLGSGNATDMALILRAGIPKLLRDNAFPASFTVGGQTFRFIIIAPQFQNVPGAADIDAVINYAVSVYKVDRNRVYLTGLSMGGGATWRYAGANSSNAERLAAIVPVAGNHFLTGTEAARIAASGVGVWATHNTDDPVVTVAHTQSNISQINSNSPVRPPRVSYFTADQTDKHDAWTRTYDPNYRENGTNVYEYMLSFQRSITSSPLPVRLSRYAAEARTDGRVRISWATTEEVNHKQFVIQRSADGRSFTDLGVRPGAGRPSDYEYLDAPPAAGTWFYRLGQTATDGTTTYFDVLKVDVAQRASLLVLGPVPARGELTVRFTAAATGPLQVTLTSASGAVLRTERWTKDAGPLQKTLSLSGLSAGTYYLNLQGQGVNERRSFVKGE